MIRFPCRCGATLEAPDDQAGLPIQCPRCGLLADVPSRADLASLEDDGSYKLDAPQVQGDPSVLPELQRVFTRKKVDEFGNEVDLRGPAGAGEQGGLPDAFEPPPERPKYDPETGELIVPMGVVPSPEPVIPKKIPLAMAAVKQARTPAARGRVSMIATPSPRGPGVLLELFRPINLLVIFIYAVGIALAIAVLLFLTGAILAAAAGAAVGGAPTGGVRIVVPLLAMLLLSLTGSHLANVVEETGPCERDALPRPLRDVNLMEDLINPAFRVAVAAVLAYGPWIGWLILLQTSAGAKLGEVAATAGYWVLYLLGTLMFPSLLLTVCTSGSVGNLRPDRVARVIVRSGGMYWLALLLWTMVALLPTGIVHIVGRVPALAAWLLLLGALPLLASLLLHGFGWLLGSIYRERNETFPWILQRHEAKPRRAFQVIPKPPAPRPTPRPPRDVR